MRKVFTVLMMLALFGFAYGQGLETFENSNATSAYDNGTFIGNDGIEWNYVHSRDEANFPIDGKGLMLRRASDSKLESGIIPGGIGSFSVQMRKAFTGGAPRQLELYINGELKGTSIEFGGFSGADDTVFDFEVADINVDGDFTIMIKNVGSTTTNRQTVLDNLSWTAFGDITNAATPQFSHPSGEYFNPFDLEITSATEDATIYYTLNGDDPDDESTEYTGPILIDQETTVKAIAYAVDLDPSSIAEATYTFADVTDVPNLQALRDAYNSESEYFRVTGEVVLTFQQSFRNQKYIEDATAAILIDDNPGIITTQYQIGDGITGMVGSLTEFGNMLQFNPAVDPGAPTSIGNVIEPQLVTISELFSNFEAYEAELVRIENVTFTDGGGFFSNGQVYEISDDSKATGSFRTTFFSVDYINTPIPSAQCNIVGLANARNDGFFITSRNLADIEVPPTITVISPNGGEQIEQGTEFEIQWSAINFDGDVEVVLHAPFTKDNIVLGVVPAADESFTWDVTQEFGEYVIIINALNLEEPWDISDEPFNIIPAIDIKITEIMYNPPESGADSLEFIEFYNNGLGTVNMLDWTISNAVSYTFPEVELQPGEYLLVAVNATAFFNTFGMEVLQWSSGALGNSGNTIELKDNNGNLRTLVAYLPGGDWPLEASGFGPSIEFCNPDLDNNDPANWTASTVLAAINAEGTGIYCTPGYGCSESPALPMLYSAGWGGISSNLIPGRMSMEELFAPVYDNLIVLLGSEGIFWPGQNINTIGDWDTYKGYKAKFDGITYFSYPGYAPESRILNLEAGTQFIPVLSEYPVSVEELIMPLGGAIEFMFDISQGLIYWPLGGILPGTSDQALNTLYPGYAYLTKVNYATTIDFGETPTKMAVENTPYQFVNNTTWNDVTATGTQHIISIAASALQNLQPGDVIGVFNPQQECVGMAGYAGNETVLPLVVYGDDITTKSIDGMLADELMNIKIFRNGETIETEAVYSNQTSHSNGLFAENGLSIITGLKAGSTGVTELTGRFSVYPNPSAGLFNIDVDGTFEVSVTNIQGQLVYSGVVNGKTQIDLGAQPDGIYIIRLQNATHTLIERIVVR